MKKTILSIILILLTSFLAMPYQAHAIVAGDLKDLSIVTHYFSTEIRGYPGSRSIKDASLGRYIVLIISTDAPTGKQQIFCHDFSLEYNYNGQENRASCLGVAPVDEDEIKTGTFIMSSGNNEPFTEVYGPKAHFGLFFYLESGVSKITLYRLGSNNATHLNIGTSRPYSVFLATNSMSPNNMKKIEEALKEGGYFVQSSRKLNSSTLGLIIIHSNKTETIAREISQRIMTRFGNVPEVRDTDLISDFDIIIWIGKGCNFKETNL